MRISDWSSDVCSADLEERNRGIRLERIGGGLSRRTPRGAVDAARRLVGKLCAARTVEPQTDGACAPVQCAACRTRPDRPALAPRIWRLRRQRLATRSEEHTSELQSLMRISYAVFCLKKQKRTTKNNR